MARVAYLLRGCCTENRVEALLGHAAAQLLQSLWGGPGEISFRIALVSAPYNTSPVESIFRWGTPKNSLLWVLWGNPHVCATGNLLEHAEKVVPKNISGGEVSPYVPY